MRTPENYQWNICDSPPPLKSAQNYTQNIYMYKINAPISLRVNFLVKTLYTNQVASTPVGLCTNFMNPLTKSRRLKVTSPQRFSGCSRHQKCIEDIGFKQRRQVTNKTCPLPLHLHTLVSSIDGDVTLVSYRVSFMREHYWDRPWYHLQC